MPFIIHVIRFNSCNSYFPSLFLRMRIFLLGFMGSGKSHWGRQWSDVYDLKFIDLDEKIENQEHKSITEIFENEGEDYFRQKEAILLRSLIKEDNCIISCGGGTPCFFDNMAWMNGHGTTVFLDASPQHLLHNITKGKNKRPLVQNHNEEELLFFIEQKLKERKKYYAEAKFILPKENLGIESFKKIISPLP